MIFRQRKVEPLEGRKAKGPKKVAVCSCSPLCVKPNIQFLKVRKGDARRLGKLGLRSRRWFLRWEVFVQEEEAIAEIWTLAEHLLGIEKANMHSFKRKMGELCPG